jgi:hypothetical protein
MVLALNDAWKWDIGMIRRPDPDFSPWVWKGGAEVQPFRHPHPSLVKNAA